MPLFADSVGSGESASPTNSIGSAGVSYQLETDSGHNSISSYCDSHSISSQGSNQNTNATPPQTQKIFNRLPGKIHHIIPPMYYHVHVYASNSIVVVVLIYIIIVLAIMFCHHFDVFNL